MALLILSPEGRGAIRAVLAKEVQQAMSLFMAQSCRPSPLMVPTVTLIAIFTGNQLTFGWPVATTSCGHVDRADHVPGFSLPCTPMC
ncbi:hypothetical protein [Sodalis sp.]|uniref:hypothetical protein n=1 Tax=Sodalis sp. (in: enterobacteria) TaxID=1898979 RepID=UPI003872ABEE